VQKLESKIIDLENRLVDKSAKPPQQMQVESVNQGALDDIQKLKDEIFNVQELNRGLTKTIQVDLKAELGRISQEKESLEEKFKILREQLNNKKLELQRILGGAPLDEIGRREIEEESRQHRIDELEEELQSTEE